MTFQEEVELLSRTKAEEHMKKLNSAKVGGIEVIPMTKDALRAVVYEAMVEGAEVLARKIREN